MSIVLPYNFVHRDYQIESWDALLADDFTRGILVNPRRCGKDLVCWNVCIAKAMQRTGLYYYMAPFYNQVRQIIWEGFDGKGRRFLDYIPEELVVSKTKLDMRIDLTNGSQIKLQGSDNIDRIVGTNPRGIVFTEYSLHKPEAWEYLRPILAENGGWAIFNGTPRGLNHFYQLYKAANNDPKWFTQYLTRDDTGVPTLEAIEADRQSGMPEELIQQEYYCSFMSGVVGSYYADLINALRKSGHITRVPYDPRLPVYTSWDIGMHDSTAIWFAQIYRQEVRIIDYYESHGKGLKEYIKFLKEKPYVYEDHFAPHDIEVREFTSGRTRRDIASDLGIEFTTTPRAKLDDGHDLVRELLPRCWFDTAATADGVSALMGYQKTYNEKTQEYSDKPLRNWAKHGADAFRILAHNVEDMVDLRDWRKPHVNPSLSYRRPRVNRSLSLVA